MCLHNARRDSFILKPVPVATAAGSRNWLPLAGALEGEAPRTRRVPPKGRTVIRRSARHETV